MRASRSIRIRRFLTRRLVRLFSSDGQRRTIVLRFREIRFEQVNGKAIYMAALEQRLPAEVAGGSPDGEQ